MFKHRHPSSTIDQASRLRRLVSGEDAESVSNTHIISVVSGKGGVGKTMVSTNLAIALAARGHRVALFDMDMGLANADIVLGIEPVATWADVLSGRRTFDEVLTDAPGGISFVPGTSGVSRLANLSEFERHQLMAAMNEIDQRFDIIVMDCGAGIARNVVEFGASADTVLVAATPEPTSITDAYATIKALARERGRNPSADAQAGTTGVIVNQAETRREGQETYERLANVAARFLHMPVSDYGYVLRDDHVSAAVRQRCPVLLRYPRCSASSCLMAIAGKLSAELGSPESKKSLFYRVMNMFL